MPAQILHSLYGQDSLTRAASVCRDDSDIRDFVDVILDEYAAPFALGCQGPDLFYHNQRTRPLGLEYGTLLHRRGYGAFSVTLLKRIIGSDSAPPRPSPAVAYALGFASHAFLDRSAHPYIVYKAGWVAPSRPETARYARCHAFFERLIDTLMLERLRSSSCSSWDQNALLVAPSASPPEGVLDAIALSLVDVYPERAARDTRLKRRIENAFQDASFFYRATNPMATSLHSRMAAPDKHLSSDRSFVALMYPEFFPLNLDYLNLSRSPWTHPCDDGNVDHRSFPELYEESLSVSTFFFASLLRNLFSAEEIRDEMAGLVGNTGLSVLDRLGVACAPSYADPLPLDGVLDSQYRMRKALSGSHVGK